MHPVTNLPKRHTTTKKKQTNKQKDPTVVDVVPKWQQLEQYVGLGLQLLVVAGAAALGQRLAQFQGAPVVRLGLAELLLFHQRVRQVHHRLCGVERRRRQRQPDGGVNRTEGGTWATAAGVIRSGLCSAADRTIGACSGRIGR